MGPWNEASNNALQKVQFLATSKSPKMVNEHLGNVQQNIQFLPRTATVLVSVQVLQSSKLTSPPEHVMYMSQCCEKDIR